MNRRNFLKSIVGSLTAIAGGGINLLYPKKKQKEQRLGWYAYETWGFACVDLRVLDKNTLRLGDSNEN